MNTKTMFTAALIGAAAMSASAGIHFGISIGLPVVTPAPVIVTAPPPPPAPVVEVAPACPGVNYVWAPGYWVYRPTGYVWMRGAWNYRPVYVHYDRPYHGGYYGHHHW